VLYHLAKMRGQRYGFRGGQICTPYSDGAVDPAGARVRTNSHDDMAFVGRVSELVGASTWSRGEPDARERARPVRRAGAGSPAAGRP
ncbi:MAG TPA: hypothetical protein VMV23_01530, partial [Candidatus Nanopelagicaceae bacterium]|nr:hypothetical protein [Candidatus Nanopelagicaceae bacterium]